MNRWWWVAWVSLLTACTSTESEGGASPDPDPTSSVTTLSTTNYHQLADVATEVERLSQTDGNRWRGVGYITPEGDLLISSQPHPMMRSGDPLQPVNERLVVRHEEGDRTSVPSVADLDHPPQFGAIVANERWIVWQDSASSDPMVNPWVMYVHDRESGTTREIYAAPHSPEQPSINTPLGSVRPVLAGDRLVWAEGLGMPAEPRSRVMACDLPDCDDPAEVFSAPGTMFPAVTDQGIYAVSDDRSDGEAGGDGSTQALHFHAFDGAERVVRTFDLPADAEITGLAAHRELVVWTENRRGKDRVVIIEGDGHGETVIEGPEKRASYFAYPSVGDDVVVWGEASGNPAAGKFGGYVYDLRSEEVYVAASVGLYQIRAAGRRVQVQEKVGQGQFDIDAVVYELLQ